MTHTRHRRVLTTVVVTATCMALATAPASAVSGGQALDTAAQPFLAKIDVGDERSGVSCSGALVAPQWLATAGSCFAESPEEPGAPRAKTTATIGGGSLSNGGGQVRQVDRIVPRGDRDLVLARLDEPVSGIAPVTMATSQPNAGDTLRASGYGRTTETWVPDQPHTGDFTVQSVRTGMVDIQGASTEASICKGDAGGPILRTTADGVALVGVASGSWQHGCLGETTDKRGATAARTDNITTWIGAQTLNLRADPASKHAINLTWTAAQATTYQVYGSQSEDVALSPENLLGETDQPRFTHTSLPADQTWHYRVAALDADGKQVVLSSTVSAVSPTETVSDFNGDGMDDIATFTRGTRGDAYVSLSDGNKFVQDGWLWHDYLAVNKQIPLSGDFNGDGKTDVAVFNGDASGDVYVSLSNGSGFSPTTRWHDYFGLTGQKITVGDVNGDGLDDIIAFTGGDAADVYVSLSTGKLFEPTKKWHDHFNVGTDRPATGDFNGDGRDDIATFSDDGHVYVSLSGGTRFVQNGWQWHPLFAPKGEVPAVGDFNGDGMDDIVTFRRGDSGDVYVSLSNGETFVDDDQKWSEFFSVGDEVPGVGDFNGDGKSDVITFTRGGEATVYVSRSDGAAFVPGADAKWHGHFATGDEITIPRAPR